jgi:UDP-N-acetylmuramoylalanine--D-glutamate ligase
VTRALVHGLASTGAAVARAMHRRGYDLVLADDSASPERRSAAVALADELGVELVDGSLADAAGSHQLDTLLRSVDLVAPAPGVPETHAVVRGALAAGVPVVSELDLATQWEADRPGGPRPMIAITGTDGKTTTTELVAQLLTSAGIRTMAVGNTEVPLVAALDDPEQGASVEVFTVECSSFRLAFARQFRPVAAIWLNFAPDHLDWHVDLASYESAKARIWAHQSGDDVAVGWTGDDVVMRHLAAAPAGRRTFGEHGDYRVTGDAPRAGAPDRRTFLGPHGELAPVAALRRRLPHDLSNAAAACAAVVESGLVAPAALADGLAAFVTPPHRIEPLGSIRGVEWFNDSKATSPHAALTAIRSFDSIVLLAGGKNKGLDLGELAVEARRIRHVVALGVAAPDVVAAFGGVCPVDVATSMRDAVDLAARHAQPGDVVLLSPACASYDWYTGYPARGDDFRAEFARVADAVHAGASGRTIGHSTDRGER